MKKLLLIVLFLVAIVATASAQALQDVVYLLNGSVVRGTLIEQVPNVKIRTSDGSVLVFKQEEIDKITSEPVQQQGQPQYDASQYEVPHFDAAQNSVSRRRGYRDLSTGMRIFADFAALVQTSYYTCSGVSYSGSFGYQLAPTFYAGLGLSAQIYIDYWYYGDRKDDEPELFAQMPLFADLRYDAFPSKVSPFVATRVGYAVSVDENNDYSGFYVSPSIGIRIKSIDVSMGLDLVKLKEPWYYEEILNNFQPRFTTVKWQSAVMIKVAYEWGGRL